MTRILNDLLAPPTFADEERTRTARLFHTYLLLDAAVSVVGAIILQIFAPRQMGVALINLALVFVAMGAVKRGHIHSVGIVALGASAVVFYISNFVTHDAFGPGTAYSLIFLAVAAFVYGRRGLWTALAVSSALVVGTTIVAHATARTDVARALVLFDAGTYLFVFMVFSFTIAVATDALWAALARAKTSERALREANAALEQRITERTEQLAQSEWHYRSLIENTSDMVSIVWPNGEVVYQSPSLEGMLGYKPEQVVGLNVFNVVHPDDVAQTQAVIQELIVSDSPGRVFEARFLHANGQWVCLEMTGKAVREGRLPGSIVITSRNITERKQAEHIIQRQAESERLVADISDKFARMMPGQMDEAVNRALQLMGEFVQADVCRLFLLEEHGKADNRLINKHEWCAPNIVSVLDPALYQNFYQKFGWWHEQMLAYNIIHIFSIFSSDELPDSIEPFRDDLRRRHVQSLLTVPLMREGQLLGEIGFDAVREARRWSPDDIRLLRVVSEMIVNVLERERIAAALQAERNLLEQRVQERTLELSQLLDVSHAISSTLQLQPLLNQVLQSLKEVVPYSSVSVSEFTQYLDLHLLAYKGHVPDEVLVRDWPYDPQADLHIFELMQSRLPVIVDDARSDGLLARAVRARYERIVGRRGDDVVNLLYVPLVARDKLVGMMTLTSDVPAQYTAAHARLAMTFANQVAVAIENARLHEHEVQSAALAERSRLARELHDSVSQALFGIVLGSRTVMQKASSASELSELMEPMSYVMRLAEAALAEMRALIFELRPESLQQEGLIAAFHKQAEALCARHQIEVTTHLGQIEPVLPIAAKEALYRIGLEAIQNTIKHAKAKRVELNLAVTDEQVQLEVCDDGIGFDATGHYPGHLGLISMRERAEKCGGSFDIGSQHGHGTAIRVQVPVDCACV